ncbi:MAG: glutamine synthetase III, partial [Clostridia bacterium]|nr:glutamine synthetase III [Clostridia bacterium]
KHDAFIAPVDGGLAITEFSGKELVKVDPDASSFPSGGLRSTFEARGYTAWDPSSYAFIKDDTLYIPTAFCSYGGEALDKKTPLLRSVQTLNYEAMRVLKALNCNADYIVTTVGPEQEYFLLPKELFDKREDLIITGKTLFGAKPPKGQELEDHYFGAIKTSVHNYMRDLDKELWKLGISAKTEHNEVAPAQHELAPVYAGVNVASDHNQLIMELMKKVALKHNLVCLLHEKPFAGINGSGKHNNWSIGTNKGENLLEPGDTPAQNVRFLLFLCAVINAVDDYQDLLRVSVASAGNDHRLGANEAPPAIVSMFLGEELDGILSAIADGRQYSKRAGCEVEIGVKVLPHFTKDTTDRNRTSPFAFTGNKFEFRMPGSSASIAGANTVINTAVAEELRLFADKLEVANDKDECARQLIKDSILQHGRIIFNGNNYCDEWIAEAKKRGLSNLTSTVDALPKFLDEKNIKLFTSHRIFTESEIHSRFEILTENYCKIMHIEALTMLDMTRKQIIPAVSDYLGKLCATISVQSKLFPDSPRPGGMEFAEKIGAKLDTLIQRASELENTLIDSNRHGLAIDNARYYRDIVIPAMNALRYNADCLEQLTAQEAWPFPTYKELLFGL